MSEGNLSKSGSKPLVIKVQLNKSNSRESSQSRGHDLRNDDESELLEDYGLDDISDDDEFPQKKGHSKIRRTGVPSKSDHDSSNTKGINTRKKRSMSQADVNFGGNFGSSGGFGTGGFAAKIEGSLETGNKRGSRGSSKASMKEEEGSEDDEQQYYSFSGNFWKGISEYIVPFVKADLDFCNIDKIPNLDKKLFQIPNLGTHYKETWHQEDQQEIHEQQQQSQEIYSGSAMQTRQVTKSNAPRVTEEAAANTDDKDANKPVRCGDITTRILSALIEDQLIPAHMLSNSYSGNFQNSNRASSESNIAPNTPTSTGNQHTMQEIDDRLKKEILSLGLIDQSGINKIHQQKEDDEICRELKRVQAELFEKAQQNKQRRAKYYHLIQTKMEEQEQERKVREEMKRLEESLTRNLKNMKKRKRAPSSSSMKM